MHLRAQVVERWPREGLGPRDVRVDAGIVAAHGSPPDSEACNLPRRAMRHRCIHARDSPVSMDARGTSPFNHVPEIRP